MSKLIDCKCTNCGGTLKVDEESNTRFACPFCKSVFVVQEAKNYYIQNNNYIVFVDKLKLASELDDFEIVGGELVRYRGSAVNVCIPSGVKIIRANAFAGFRAIETVNLPEECYEIGDHAFYDCESLKLICCRSKTLTFSPKMKTIGMSAFENCRKLQKIIMPSAVTELGERAFANCSELFEFICLAKGWLDTIKKSTFEGCTNLIRISILSTVTIEERAFYNCTNLSTADLQIKDIKPSAFYNCHKLSDINLYCVQSIGSSAFENCFSLPEEIEFDWLDIRIGARAFMNCKSIQKIIVTRFYVEQEAFADCENLSEIELAEPYMSFGEVNCFARTPIEHLYQERRKKNLCVYCGSKTKPIFWGFNIARKCLSCDKDIYRGYPDGQPYGYHVVFSSLGLETEQYRIKHKLCRYCGEYFVLNSCINPNCLKKKDY